MATKYFHSLSDENPDLRKQIGCMTGVFHIFNRNQIVSRNRFIGHHRNRIPSNSLLFNNGTPERESSVNSPNLGKHFTEKQRLSTESYKESCSSWSPSSPFSYVDRRPSQSVDLRDIVKDSMYREARGLSPKTITKHDSNNVLVELESPNWYRDEPSELSRSKSCQFKDGFPFSVSKNYPRFSYDGRERDRLSIKDEAQSQSQSQTTTLKQMKELPRLSLDSRERSIRTLNSVSLVPIKSSDSKSNLNPKNGGLIQTRPPSVVAKLMGLEALPESTSDKKLGVDIDSVSKSLKETDDCDKSIRMQNPTKDQTSPSWKNPDLKPISRVPNEAAPWKQRENGQNSQKTSPRVTKSTTVYSEVDKRLKNLEFEQSGKDLRALKQILEAMQVVEDRKGKKGNTVDCQNPSSENVFQESNIVIMKPAKFVEKGPINNKKGKDPTSSKDSFKSRKKSESRSPNRRQKSSSSTQEKSTLVEKVGESVNPEYPSPVSVLDDSVYMENSPSPVKYKPNTRKDYAKKNLAENIAKDQYEATNIVISSVTSQINREKLHKVERLVQELKMFNSSHDESHTDYIALLSENTNPNNRYISEIFLASGILLRDLESIEFHSSGHPINPNLFLVLEQTKFSDQKKDKFHRKLIFDAVNEILVEKLNSVSLMMKNPRELLRELCLEIEQMQVEKESSDRCDFGMEEDDDLKRLLREDVMKRSENWRGFYGESPVVAMEVEWLIFRDLVYELVVSEGCDDK